MQRDAPTDPQISEPGETFPPLVDHAIVLTGPTASGKSAVAMELAQQIDGEIISLDSIAVYEGMNIGTAKPSQEDQALVPHHMIDVVPPTEDYSVACYLKAAHETVSQIADRGRTAIFVGGTPMFLKSVLRGFDPGPPADWDFRNAVEADVEKHGAEALHKRLMQVDPLAAHQIDPNDVRRMTRALEVARVTGQPISHRQIQFNRARSADDCFVFAMQVPRDQLHDRINRRVEWMFDAGLVQEVQGLLDQHGDLSRTASQAVGYRELIDCFSGDKDLQRAQTEIAAHTRQLARRQETWFRSFNEIRSLPAADPVDPSAIATELARLIRARHEA